jgi:hypothetical protein
MASPKFPSCPTTCLARSIGPAVMFAKNGNERGVIEERIWRQESFVAIDEIHHLRDGEEADAEWKSQPRNRESVTNDWFERADDDVRVLEDA